VRARKPCSRRFRNQSLAEVREIGFHPRIDVGSVTGLVISVELLIQIQVVILKRQRFSGGGVHSGDEFKDQFRISHHISVLLTCVRESDKTVTGLRFSDHFDRQWQIPVDSYSDGYICPEEGEKGVS
jgi:hypothetical protein